MAANRFHSPSEGKYNPENINIRHRDSDAITRQTFSSDSTNVPSSTPIDRSQKKKTGARQSSSSHPSSDIDPRLEALENNTVYLAVHTRSEPGSYHCGLFISRSKDAHDGLGWLVHNDQGGWHEELLSFNQVLKRPHLLLLHRMAQVHKGKEESCAAKIRTLGANGMSSGNRAVTIPESSRLTSGLVQPLEEDGPAAQKDWDSMARVKQAMRTLLDSDLITVSANRAETLDKDVSQLAGQMWDQVVRHKRPALVT